MSSSCNDTMLDAKNLEAVCQQDTPFLPVVPEPINNEPQQQGTKRRRSARAVDKKPRKSLKATPEVDEVIVRGTKRNCDSSDKKATKKSKKALSVSSLDSVPSSPHVAEPPTPSNEEDTVLDSPTPTTTTEALANNNSDEVKLREQEGIKKMTRLIENDCLKRTQDKLQEAMLEIQKQKKAHDAEVKGLKDSLLASQTSNKTLFGHFESATTKLASFLADSQAREESWKNLIKITEQRIAEKDSEIASLKARLATKQQEMGVASLIQEQPPINVEEDTADVVVQSILDGLIDPSLLDAGSPSPSKGATPTPVVAEPTIIAPPITTTSSSSSSSSSCPPAKPALTKLPPMQVPPKCYCSYERRTIEKKRLEYRVKSLKLSIVNVPGEGNCLFHAIAHHVGEDHLAVRLNLSRWLLRNKDFKYSPLFPELTLENFLGVNENWADYVKTMTKQKVFGDSPCYYAAAEFYGRPILVVSGHFENYDHCIVQYSPTVEKSSVPIRLGHADTHFDALLENDSVTVPSISEEQFMQQTWYCKSCLRENELHEFRCSSCGFDMLGNCPSAWNCTRCKHCNPLTQRICIGCGTPRSCNLLSWL